MPDLPELSARGPLALGIVSCLVLLAGVLGWAAQAAITSAVVAAGEVDVAPFRYPVQHPEGGVISEVLVREGQSVAAGDLLMRIDGTALRTEIAFLDTQIIEVEARQVRLQAEREGAAFPPPSPADLAEPERARALAAQRRLHEARRETFERQGAQLAQRRLQSEAALAGLIRQRAGMEEESAILTRELEAQRSLQARGLTLTARVSELARDRARLSGALAAIDARENELLGQIGEIAVQAAALRAARQEDAESQFVDTGQHLVELRARRAALEARLRTLDLRAPAAGVVHAMAITAADSVLRPADVAMQIVAPSAVPVLRVRVNPDEIDHVMIGQAARLRFPGLASRNLGDLPGRVSTISAASFLDDRSGARHFRVDILPEPEAMEALGPRALVPGMSVQAFITTGVRTPLDYLMQPVQDHFARALRER